MEQLTVQELYQYDRQIALRGFDIDKQTQLKNSSAIIIGVGGLGCAASLYLTSAGIGKLTLVDFDIVSKANLSRQILYTENSVNQFKVDEAKQALLKIRPTIEIEAVKNKLSDEELSQMFKNHSVVIDCTDNLASRQQINQCCYRIKKPLISGAAIRMEGLLSVFTYQDNEPCYQCLSQLFGQNQLSCVETGVMAPLVGMFGTMQALEAIKVICNYGTPLTHRLLMIDAMNMKFKEVRITKQSSCSICNN